MDVSGKKFLVVGAGRSGLAAADLLQRRGAQVTINDRRTAEALGGQFETSQSVGATLALGHHDESLFTSADAIVVSPGVPALPSLEAAAQAEVPIYSEVELASWFLRAKLIGITGTNGKSTVTSMLGAICERSGVPTFVGGNLGVPLVDAVDSPANVPNGVVVAELSSFQLERLEKFRADVALLLNVTPDHLDRYESFDHYADTKGEIFRRQGPDDVAVIPAGDARCQSLANNGNARRITFGRDEGDVRLREGRLVYADADFEIALSEIKVPGAHNVLNACAAVGAACAAGVAASHVAEGLAGFRGLPHRAQWVAEAQGVTFYDDSKATNVGAAVAAVQGLQAEHRRLVVVAGGRDKGGSYAPLREALEAYGCALVLVGESSPIIKSAFAGSAVEMFEAESMSAAVEAASRIATPRDAVVLAPACSSFDMYGSYAERGDDFQRLVLRHTGGSQ